MVKNKKETLGGFGVKKIKTVKSETEITPEIVKEQLLEIFKKQDYEKIIYQAEHIFNLYLAYFDNKNIDQALKAKLRSVTSMYAGKILVNLDVITGLEKKDETQLANFKFRLFIDNCGWIVSLICISLSTKNSSFESKLSKAKYAEISSYMKSDTGKEYQTILKLCELYITYFYNKFEEPLIDQDYLQENNLFKTSRTVENCFPVLVQDIKKLIELKTSTSLDKMIHFTRLSIENLPKILELLEPSPKTKKVTNVSQDQISKTDQNILNQERLNQISTKFITEFSLIRLQEIAINYSRDNFNIVGFGDLDLSAQDFTKKDKDNLIVTLNLAIALRTYAVFESQSENMRSQIDNIFSHSENQNILQIAKSIENKSDQEILADKSFIEFIVEDLQLQTGLSFYTLDDGSFKPTYIYEYLEQIKKSLTEQVEKTTQNQKQKETAISNLKNELTTLISEKEFELTKQSSDFIDDCNSKALLGSIIFAIERIAENGLNYNSLSRHKVKTNDGFLQIGDWINYISKGHRMITRNEGGKTLITHIGNPHDLPEYRK